MLIIRYLGTFVPEEAYAHHVLCGVDGITLFDEHDCELMEISYDILISIRVK